MQNLSEKILKSNRIVTIDAIRGLAVLLLFLANVPIWNDSIVASRGDMVSYLIRSVFTDAWLYMAFSLAFGASIMLYSEVESNSWKVYKRFFVLGIIGILHGLFLNYQDILALYAILGFIAYQFRNKSARSLLTWSLGFFFYMPVLLVMLSISSGQPELLSINPSYNVHSSWFSYFIGQLVTLGFGSMSMILLGMGLAKTGFFIGGEAWERVYTFCWALLPLGIVCMLIQVVSSVAGISNAFTLILYLAGGPLVTLAIVSFVAKFKLAFLAELGQITLSLYLLQSLVGVILFRGLGWQLTVTQELELGLTAIPVWLCVSLLLEKYKPMERIYRLAST